MKKDKKPSPIIRLLAYTGNYKGLLFSGLFLSAIAMVLGMAPYICIWLVIKDLISVAPNWSEAASIAQYGWMAFAFAVGGILIYFFALMCTHLAAFRTASNIRKQGMARLMKTPLGFFDNNASGLLRNRLDGAAGETETLLAHNLADIVGTAAMFIAMLVLMFLFRKNTEAVDCEVETQVDDLFPSWLMIGVVLMLILASFLPKPADPTLAKLHSMRSGLSCLLFALIGLVRAAIRERSMAPFSRAFKEMDLETLLLLFGLFIVIEGIRSAGVIDAIAALFHRVAGNNPLTLFVLIVGVSVVLSAFIDNIPYVATMLPVVRGIAALMGTDPTVFYFGLLTGATLGGNLTPIGASANITAIGILRKNGETVTSKDFLRIGVPFTLTAVIVGAAFIWAFWGIRT